MRIISGNYRGKILNSPKDNRVRPTSDMVKEGVFNIIQFKVLGSCVLDLFAGSGAIGAEMLSRGAYKVYLADCDQDSLAIVKSNFKVFDSNDFTIMHSDYKDTLKVLKGIKFDIIYVDPPYEMLIIDDVLRLILQYDLLRSNGIVIYESLFETNRKSSLKDFQLAKSRKYGTVAIDIYELYDIEKY